MPTKRLGQHSSALAHGVSAFESEVGLPLGSDVDVDWLVRIVRLYNEKYSTSIEFSHEDYGYWFR